MAKSKGDKWVEETKHCYFCGNKARRWPKVFGGMIVPLCGCPECVFLYKESFVGVCEDGH